MLALLILSETERAQTGDTVRSRTDKKEPLGKEIGNQDQIVAIWYGFDEPVPCQNEIRKDKEYCSEGIEGASLEQTCQKHC